MSYLKELRDGRWKSKRIEILERDSFKCKQCQNKTIENQSEVGKILDIITDDSALTDPLYLGNKSDPRFAIPKIKYELQLLVNGGKEITAELYTYEELAKNFDNTPLSNLSVLFSLESNDDSILIYGIKKANSSEWFYARNLNIHHTYYQQDRSPWDYPNKCFETLCLECHKSLHKNREIPVYDENHNKIPSPTICKKCDGLGYIPEYAHRDYGICYRCWGTCFEEVLTSI